MAEILAIIVGLLDAPAKIKQYVIEPLKVQFSYLCCSDSIIDSLKAKVRTLDDTIADLQQRVDAAEHNLEIVEPQVKNWFESVDKIKKETDRILRPIPEVQQGCVNGRCTNLKSRYSVSRDAKKIAKDIDEVLDAGKFEIVAHPAPPPGRETIPVVSGTDFKSRENIEEEIMATLKDDKVYLIGICGMGGVGKTTMVKKIEKRAREENLFRVAMAVVSQQPDLKRMQEQIAEDLDLKLKGDEISSRARQIYLRLTKETRVLIIIDDIWEIINLGELGIPSQSNHKGCKIILTSRVRSVCKGMEAMSCHVATEIQATETENTKIFPLECLDEEEAWVLFRSKAGICVDDRDLHQIGKKVARECKGLPLALVTVGCALRAQNTKHVWEDALAQLKKSAPLNIPGVLKGVYQPLELSYKHLESDEARDLFLLCCLFPEDSRISLKDFLYYGVGLRIFSNLETLYAARNRVYGLIERLESRYMLTDDGTDKGIKYVKIHDVIRDMAISIASKGKQVLTRHGLDYWPRNDVYENYSRISLTVKGRSVTLPECINCPGLEMLRIKFRWDGQIPDTFFVGMRKLNVLDIGHITSLPSSLQFLTNLRTLSLRKSKMKTIPMIGQLVKLEILDLSDSKLEVLPKEIGGLENLRSLDLSRCSKLREIAPGVVSNLVRLEELFVLYSFQRWEAEVEGNKRGNASLVEVASLKNLTALQLQIPDPEVLPQDKLHWPRLDRFALWIGTPPFGEDYHDSSLILNLNEITPLVHALTKKAHRLRLNGCDNMNYFGGPLLAGSFDALKNLRLQDLNKVTHLWDQKLCLSNLNDVFIRNCSSLQYVFLQSTAESLSRLQTLEIKKCPILKEVFKAESEGSAGVVSPIVFRNLTILKLKELANLNSFCKAVNGINFPRLHTLYIKSSNNLKVFCPMEESSFFEQGEQNSESQFLFHKKVTFGSLVRLVLYNIKTATKIFSSQIPMDSFCQLKVLTVASCPNLKFIFAPSAAFRNFGTLDKLIVTNCSKLEEVVRKEDEELQAVVKELLFPELKNLMLFRLPNFRSFCHMKNDVELPQLEKITMQHCDKMGSFSLGSLSLPSLAYVARFLEPDLASQIFFNKKTPRHEIHLKNNSFGLSAKDLSIFDSEVRKCWEWGSAKVSSDNFVVVARLLEVRRLRISGKFEMDKLLPETLYEVVFEVKLEESRFQCGGPVNLKLTQLEGITQERLEDLEHKPRGEWIEILAGVFMSSLDPIGDLEFSLHHHEMDNPKRGLLIKGVTIRPKA